MKKRTRIFSFGMAVLMLVLAIPTAMIPATATEKQGDTNAMTAQTVFGSNLNLGTNDSSYFWPTVPTASTGAYTWDNKGSFEIGSIKTTWTEAGKYGDFAYGWQKYLDLDITTFHPYNMVDTAGILSNMTGGRTNCDDAGHGGSFAVNATQPNNNGYLSIGASYSGNNITKYQATPSIRYTAPYAGKATIEVAGRVRYGGADYIYAVLLVNGEVKYSYNSAVAESVYTGSVEIDLNVGDVVDMVVVADTNAYMASGNSNSALRWSMFVNKLAVTYTEVNNTATALYNQSYNDWSIGTSRFNSDNKGNILFTWYNKDGKVLSAGETLDDACYAVISPEAKTALGINDNTTWAEAYAKFKNHMKSANPSTSIRPGMYHGAEDAFYEFGYAGGFYNGTNLLLLKDGKIGTLVASAAQYANYRLLFSEFEFDNLNLKSDVDKCLTDTSNGTLATDESKVGDLRVYYSDAKAITFTNATNVGGNAYAVGEAASNTAVATTWSLRPGYGGAANAYFNTRGAAALAYTAEYDGKLIIKLNDMIANGNAFSWNIRVNGVYLFDSFQLSGTTDAEIALINEKLATLNTTVNAGDTVLFLFARTYAGTTLGGTTVSANQGTGAKPNVSMGTLATTTLQKVDASLTLSSSYDVNLYITNNNALQSAPTVNGITTQKQENGSYKAVLESGIGVTEFSGNGKSIDYTIVAQDQGHTLTMTGSVNTSKLLQTYQNHSDVMIANLATDLRAVSELYATIKAGKTEFDSTLTNWITNKTEKPSTYKGIQNYVALEGASYDLVSANVNLGDNISLVVRIQANGTNKLEDLLTDYKIYATCNGADYTTNIISHGTTYAYAVIDVPISMYNSTVEMKVQDASGNAVSGTVAYSVGNWCKNMAEKTTGLENLFIHAIYNLGISSNRYTSQISVSYTSGSTTFEPATESISILVPTGKGYIEYNIIHTVSESINANNWRISQAYMCDDINGTNRTAITVPGAEWDMAIQIKNAADFVGGYAHGDEICSDVKVYINGVETALSAIGMMQECSEISIVTNSIGYHPGLKVNGVLDETDKGVKLFDHEKTTTITKNGIKVEQKITWAGDYELGSCYMAMMPPMKEYTNMYFTDTDQTPKELPALNYTIYETNVKSVCVYGEESGLYYTMSIEEYNNDYANSGKMSVADNYSATNTNPLYNKMYFYYCQGSNAVNAGDVWEAVTYFDIQRKA